MPATAMMRPQSNGLHSASSAQLGHGPPPIFRVRHTLPDRNVDGSTIEDAYVRFILYCNPAVPLDTDTVALRQAFQTPPKSGGKSFSTFTLFELIRRLERKEIKTWAELALRLGVEPPDQDRGQSSQKIQQYAVRLKRWMHSMHVDAFFDYLLDHLHPYWAQVPTEPGLACDTNRDGVAPEDDMALRALLPHIRPKRGRKRPEEDELSKSPSQRPRLDSPAMGDDFGGIRQDSMDLWTAQPDGRSNVFLFPPSNDMRMAAAGGQPPVESWGNQDVSQTPMTAYPHSAITPSTRNAFWNDEPRSAITPSKARSSSRRHGAKVVSSAWRSGGPGGSGKTRGRPPINRNPNDGPFSAFPTTDTTSFRSNPREQQPTPVSVPPQPVAPPHPPQIPPTPMVETPTSISDTAMDTAQVPNQASQPKPRNRLSLQVPERAGGNVRLATPPPPQPPPVVMVSGPETPSMMHQTPTGLPNIDLYTLNIQNTSGYPLESMGSLGGPFMQPPSFQDPTDRSNMPELESYFISNLLQGEWYDVQGNPTPACGFEEAQGIVTTVIENLRKAALTKEAFLINVSALAGARLLMKTRLRVDRTEELHDRGRYTVSWELRLGDMRVMYTLKETVPHDIWKRPADRERDGSGSAATATEGGSIHGGDGVAGAAHWQQKYRDLLAVVRNRDEQLTEIRATVLGTAPKESG